MTTRIIALALPVALTLALAGPAGAKKIQKVEACGSSGCRDITSAVRDEGFFDFGTTRTSPPRAGFYKVQMSVGDDAGQVHDTFPFLFSPAARKVRVEDESGQEQWFLVTAATARRFAAAIPGLAPFPASRLASDESAADPAARIVETFQPAGDGDDDGSGGLAALLGGAAALVAAGLGALWWRRRRRVASTGSPAAAG